MDISRDKMLKLDIQLFSEKGDESTPPAQLDVKTEQTDPVPNPKQERAERLRAASTELGINLFDDTITINAIKEGRAKAKEYETKYAEAQA